MIKIKHLYLIVFAALLAVLVPAGLIVSASADSWHTVGIEQASGSANVSAGSFTVAENGTPYALYNDLDDNYRGIVLSFSNGTWSQLGAAFSDDTASFPVIKTFDNVPYVAFRDTAHGDMLTVKKFTGAIWETVGTAGFGETNPFSISLDFASDGTPYVGYIGSSYHNTVMRYTGAVWETVGSGTIESGISSNGTMVVLEDVPYVAYSDSGDSYKVSVKKLSGASWTTVGSLGITPGSAFVGDLAVAPDNTLYLGFADSGSSDKRVLKFDGTQWSQLGANGDIDTGVSSKMDIQLSGSTPYLAYQDSTSNISVKQFDGTSWETVGSGALTSSGSAVLFGLSISSIGDVPYIAYRDTQGGDPYLSVQKFGTGDEGGSTTFANAEDGKSIILTLPDKTSLTCSSSSKEEAAHPDSAYNYPLGLVHFCFTAGQATNQVTLDFATILSASQVVARKYDATTHTYTTIPGAVITATTVAGQPGLRLAYSITDGGVLDQDGVVNGEIVDPVGLAVAEGEVLADTGVALVLPIMAGITLVSIGIFELSIRRRTTSK